MESENCLQLGWQEERQKACRGNEEGLSPSMVCYTGHTTPRAISSPGVDPSTCLSCRCLPSHGMSARSDPGRGKDGEMETWAAGVIFQSVPCTFKLGLLFLSRGALLQCGELHRACHHRVPLEHVWSAAGRK